MRLKILRRPAGTIDGVSLDHFRVGGVYEVGSQVASVFLVEGWAEIVAGDDASVFAHPPAESAAIKPVVLVVDDEPALRQLTEVLLTSHGYQVAVACQGKEAIDRLREHSPDLIVLDLNMPVMNGWQFRTEQRYLTDKKLAGVPVLLLTGVDNAAEHADTLRAVGVVKKPVDPDDLLDAVSAAIGSQISAPDGIRSTRPWKQKAGRAVK